MSLEKKFWTLKSEKESQETLLTDNIRNVQNDVLAKKREMDHLMLNMANDQELEIKNLKFKNELEIKFAKQLEIKEMQLEELNNHINGLEKQIHLSKYALDAQKNDHSRGYEALKETHKMKVDSLTKEMGLLRNQINFDENKEELRNLKLQNELLNNKLEKSDKLVKEMAEKIEKISSQKALSTVESVKEIERIRKELNIVKLEKDKLELRNDILVKENDELQLDFKKGENSTFELSQQKKSLNNMLEKQKQISNDLEDQINEQRNLTTKMFLEKSKDSSKRDTYLQSQILELKSELRASNAEKEKIKRLHGERLLGVKNSNQNLESKCDGLREEISRLNELIGEHDIRKIDQNQKVFNLQKELEELSENFEKVTLQKNRTDRELREYKDLEEKGLLISEKQKDSLDINDKMLKDLKKSKIENLKIKKAYANMNKKLVEAVSEKVICQAKYKVLAKKMGGNLPGSVATSIGQNVTEIKRFDLSTIHNVDPNIALQNHMQPSSNHVQQNSSKILLKQNINIVGNRDQNEIQEINNPFPEPVPYDTKHEALLGNPFNQTMNTLTATSGITSANFGTTNISFQNQNIGTSEHPFARGVDETDSTYHMINVRTDGNSTVTPTRQGSISPDGRIKLGEIRQTGIHSEYGASFRQPRTQMINTSGPDYLVQKHLVSEVDNLRNNLRDHPGMSSNVYATVGNLGQRSDNVRVFRDLPREGEKMPKFVSFFVVKQMLISFQDSMDAVRYQSGVQGLSEDQLQARIASLVTNGDHFFKVANVGYN